MILPKRQAFRSLPKHRTLRSLPKCQTFRSLPRILPGFALGKAEEEDLEADEPEGGEEGVVDDVEGGDFEPGHRGPGEDLTRVWVVDHVPEYLFDQDMLLVDYISFYFYSCCSVI